MQAAAVKVIKSVGGYVAKDGTIIISPKATEPIKAIAKAVGGYHARDGSLFVTALRRVLR
jgi:hypothetical protein